MATKNILPPISLAERKEYTARIRGWNDATHR